MRLIDADALKKAIDEVHQKDLLMNPLWGSIGLNTLNRLIDNAPTVEPERPQGEWEHIHDNTNKQRIVYKCSVCGRIIDVYYREDLAFAYPFCHCGADMRKGGAEE